MLNQEVTTMFPTFSGAERERRWNEVRQRMEQEGIDALIMLPAACGWGGDVGGANQRYLSQVGGASLQVALLFPHASDPTLVMPMQSGHPQWQQLSWVENIRRSADGRYSRILVERIKD